MSRDGFKISQVDPEGVQRHLERIIRSDPQGHEEEIIWMIRNYPSKSLMHWLSNVAFLPSDGGYYKMSELFYSRDEETSILFQGESGFVIDKSSKLSANDIEDVIASKMKRIGNVTSGDILKVAQSIHSCGDAVNEKKLKFLLKVANQRHVVDKIKDFDLIPTLKRPALFSLELPWHGGDSGGRQPISQTLPSRFAEVTGSGTFISRPEYDQFVNQNAPSVGLLLEQLKMYVTNSVLPPGEIYSLIASYPGQVTQIKSFIDELDQWVLTEDGLKSLKEVSLKKADSVTFSPCIFQPVKEIVDNRIFYRQLGVRPELQNKDVRELCKVRNLTFQV